jgi:hypothetical protein
MQIDPVYRAATTRWRNNMITISHPTFPEATTLSQEDVWGEWDHAAGIKTAEGMVVATSEQKCPVWKDTLPYKSVTVIGPKALSEQIAYWLEFVHGADCISKAEDLPDGKVAFRSDYQCW